MPSSKQIKARSLPDLISYLPPEGPVLDNEGRIDASHFRIQGPYSEELISGIWDVYAGILRSRGIAELRAIESYLREQLRDLQAELTNAENSGPEVGQGEDPDVARGLRYAHQSRLERLKDEQGELSLRLVALENIIWRYCVFGDDSDYAEVPTASLQWISPASRDRAYSLLVSYGLISDLHSSEEQPWIWLKAIDQLAYLLAELSSRGLISSPSFLIAGARAFANKERQPINLKSLRKESGGIPRKNQAVIDGIVSQLQDLVKGQ